MISVTFTERFCFIVFSDFLNTLITQSISKGFRILGCSIFKMPFVFCYPFLSDNFFIIPHLFSFVKSFSKLFWDFFRKLFLSFRAAFSIIPHFLHFVKYFSELFWRIFLTKFFAFVRYFLVYHILSLLSSPFVIFFYCPFFCPFRKILYSRLRSSFRFLRASLRCSPRWQLNYYNSNWPKCQPLFQFLF